LNGSAQSIYGSGSAYEWFQAKLWQHYPNACTIHLSQHAYLNSILHCYNFTDIKSLSMPMDTQAQLTFKQAPSIPAEFAVMHDIPYHEAIGTLNWAVLTICPDITFAIATVVCFGANPRPMH